MLPWACICGLLGVSLVVIIAPGPDMVLVGKNAGLLVWTVAPCSSVSAFVWR